jgi:hypothetical protein
VPEHQSGKEIVRLPSPPLREDDKDGHYVFSVGDNLTSRCNYTTHDLLPTVLMLVCL